MTSSFDDSVSFSSLSDSTNRSYLVGFQATPTGNNICLGALISPNTVISGNCPVRVNNKLSSLNKHGFDSDKNSYNILYSSIGNRFRNGDSYGEIIKLKSWQRHPNYNAKSAAYSFYLFKLESKSSQEPIMLGSSYNNDMEEGKPAMTMGWFNGSANSRSLHFSDMKFYGQTPCAKILKKELGMALPDTNVCAVSTSSEEDACSLIHGSPLIFTKNGREFLLGLLNYSYGCGRTDMPSVFTRLVFRQYVWVGEYAGIKYPYSFLI